MSENLSLHHLRAAVDFIGQYLSPDERIIQIREGKTHYARQTYVYYLINVATLENRTGNDPIRKRSMVVKVNVDTTSAANAERSEWAPYDYVYGD